MTLLLEQIDELRRRSDALLTEAHAAAEAQRYREANRLLREAELLFNGPANVAAALGAQHEELTL